jgi:hypothetical protein
MANNSRFTKKIDFLAKKNIKNGKKTKKIFKKFQKYLPF